LPFNVLPTGATALFAPFLMHPNKCRSEDKFKFENNDKLIICKNVSEVSF
jgi:hypothetical protein